MQTVLRNTPTLNFGMKSLEGRDHYVVPTVMLVEGVLNGSGGPILYTAEEMEKSAPLWNGKPVVVYHPDMYVSPIAGNPAVFNKQKVGVIFNTRFEQHAGHPARLTCEAWIDEHRVAMVDANVETTIQDEQFMEVSTGLFFKDYVNGRGVYNGREYDRIGQGYIPDHLAILPDKVGACSIADGAGLCRNELGQAYLFSPFETQR